MVEINNFNKTAKNRGLIATPFISSKRDNGENKFNNLLIKLDPWITNEKQFKNKFSLKLKMMRIIIKIFNPIDQ